MPARRGLLALALCLAVVPAAAQPLTYPDAPRADVVDDYFGRAIADPYRPLENPELPATRQWIEAQNALTFGVLGGIAERDSIRKLLTRLWNYPRTDVPLREAGQLWFTHNTGLQRQPVLYRVAAPGASPEVVLDPNTLSADGSVAVGQWSISPDGKLVAYTRAGGGSDLRNIHVLDRALGRDLPDVVPNIKFSGIAWTRDGKGFFYSRFRSSERRANLRDPNTHHTLFYHRLGEATDRAVFTRTDDSTASAAGSISDDGRWLYVSSSEGTSNNRLGIADLGDPMRPRIDAPLHPVASAHDAFYRPLGVVDRTLYVHTNWQAPRGRIVAVAIGDTARARWRTVLAEGPHVIDKTLLVGDRFVVAYQVDVRSRLQLFDLTGAPRGEVALPDLGTVSSTTGRNDGSDVFFNFSSYLRPPAVYRYDLAAGRLEEFRRSTVAFDASPYETRLEFFTSKDGTRVPLFVTARKDLVRDGTNPTLLYGYGGFDISLRPSFSAAVAAWLELGGVYAVANLRGGGEYGAEWHHAGMRERKQNVFDDFIAAAEYLISERVTGPRSLAILGGSNGGLLVGAAMTQRPDLFAVALPAAGVMDMMRYQKFTGGRFWIEEYGSSEDSAAVRYLLDYSPLHKLASGTCYPATMVTAADHDDRVVPAHSFKFGAALQKAQGCERPVLIRIQTQGSHNFRTTESVIAEYADRFTFALQYLRRGTSPASGNSARPVP